MNIPLLVPLLPHPPHSNAPPLHRIPSRPTAIPASKPFADCKPTLDGWRVDLHIFTAAYPRSAVDSVCPSTKHHQPASPSHLSKEQLDAEAERILNIQNNKKPTDIVDPDLVKEPPLWVAVNRYVPENPDKDGFTLILLSACSFTKESWEPTIAEILSRPDCPPIYDIWALDNVWHGDTALLNQEYSCSVYEWADYGRDLLKFILRFLPPAGSKSLPIELIQQPLDNEGVEYLDEDEEKIAGLRSHNRSWRGRRIVAVGHSYGGSAVIYAASALPTLFYGIILIDPSIEYGKDALPIIQKAVRNSVVRINRWPSINHARDYFVNQLEVQWRSDVLERHLHFGLIKVPEKNSSRVMLKTPKEIEQLVYAEIHSLKDVYGRLRLLPSDLPVHWIVPQNGSVTRDIRSLEVAMLYVRQSTIVKLLRGGHLLPLDNTEETAIEIANNLKHIAPATLGYSANRARL